MCEDVNEKLTAELARGEELAKELVRHVDGMGGASSGGQTVTMTRGGKEERWVVTARADFEEERWREEIADAARKEEWERCAGIVEAQIEKLIAMGMRRHTNSLAVVLAEIRKEG